MFSFKDKRNKSLISFVRVMFFPLSLFQKSIKLELSTYASTLLLNTSVEKVDSVCESAFASFTRGDASWTIQILLTLIISCRFGFVR